MRAPNIICRGASEVLQRYFKELGGRPQPASKLGKRKSSSQLKAASDSPAPKKSKRANGNGDGSMDDHPQRTGSWVPDTKNWESEIASIDTVERDRDTGKLWAFIYFTNGKRSRIGMEIVYQRCPIPMLKFYEKHLSVFSPALEISCDMLSTEHLVRRLPERSPAADVHRN